MWRYRELKQVIQFKLLDRLPDANTHRHIWSYLASDRDIDLFLCGLAQCQLHDIQVSAVHRVWHRLLLGKPAVYIGNRICLLDDDVSDSDLESDDGIWSAHYNYINLFWKTQLSKNGVHGTYAENRPLMIIIRFLGKPPFPEAPRRQFAHQSLSPAQIVANAVQRRSASAESSRECKRRRSAEPIRQQTSDHHHSASSE